MKTLFLGLFRGQFRRAGTGFYIGLLILAFGVASTRGASIGTTATAYDVTMAPLAGVTVTLAAVDNCDSYSEYALTAANGQCAINYIVAFGLCGFLNQSDYNVTIAAGKTGYGFNGPFTENFNAPVYNSTANYNVVFTESYGPPVVVGEGAGAVSQTGATLSGAFNPANLASGATFQYGTNTSYGQSTPCYQVGAGSQTTRGFNQTLGNLYAGLTYHWCLTVSNASGTVSSADQTFTTPPPTISLGQPSVTFAAQGGVSNVVMTVTPAGLWTAYANASWLHLISPGSGIGTTSVVFVADPNMGASMRVGTLALGSQILLVYEAPATMLAGTTNLVENAGGGSDSVALGVSPAGWAWTAAANASWLHLAATSGNGSANVIFTYDANPGGTRTGTLTVGGQTVTVTQAGPGYAAAGVVTLVNTGPAITANGFYTPQGLAVDAGGNVYIADTGHNAVKEWNAQSGTLSVLVGSGLNEPTGVAVDAAGNVFIADDLNYTVDEWQAASGTVTTQAPISGYQPLGVAIGQGLNTNVCIAAASIFNPGAILQYNAGSSALSTLAAGPPLDTPYGVGVDVAGNIYVADYTSNSIVEDEAASGTLVTLTTNGLATPYGLAVDGGGNVYVADEGDSAIKEWNAATSTLVTLLTGTANNSSSPVDAAEGVAVDAAGDLYIANTFGESIEELPRAYVPTNAVEESADAGSDVLPAVVPATLNFTPPLLPTSDQSWLTINGVSGGVVSFAFTANLAKTGRSAHISLLGQSITVTQPAPIFPGYSLGDTNLLEGPAAGTDSTLMAVSPTNYNWSAAASAPWLHLASSSGVGATNLGFSFDANPGPTRTATLTLGPAALAEGSTTLTITQAGATYAPASLATLATPPTLDIYGTIQPGNPLGVVADSQGNVYLNDTYHDVVGIYAYSISSLIKLRAGSGTPAPLMASGLATVQQMAVDGAGNLYLANQDYEYPGNNAILELPAGGGSVISLVSSDDGLGAPAGVALDPQGNVYIADTGNNAIEEWTPGGGGGPGTLTTLVALAAGDSLSPGCLAVDALGNVYFDYNDASFSEYIEEWSPGSATPTTLVLNPGGTTALAVDGGGNLYYNATYYGTVTELQSATGNAISEFPGGINPRALAVDAGRNLYATSSALYNFQILPHAWVDPSTRVVPFGGGTDALPPVLPASANLAGYSLPASDQSWLTVSSVAGGVVSYAFTANPGDTPRTAHISLLGQSVTIEQQPLPTFTLARTNLLESPAAGADSVLLAEVPAGSAWTVTPNASWLHAPLASGQGSTNVNFLFDANPGPVRTGTLTVGDQTLTVTQAGSNYVAAALTTLAYTPTDDLNLPGIPSGVAVDPAGNVFVADQDPFVYANSILELPAGGTSFIPYVTNGLETAGTVSWAGLAVDASDNLYIADTTGQVLEVPQGATNGVALVTPLNDPRDVAVDGQGNLFIAEGNSGNILEENPVTGTLSTALTLGTSDANGVAVDFLGNLYVADDANRVVEELVAANTNLVARENNAATVPDGVAVDGGGNVFFGDFVNNAIDEWQPATGLVSTLATGAGGPDGLALDGAGNVYVVDYGDNALKELPNAYVNPAPVAEPATAGSDALAPVLPATFSLTGAFAPASDQPWLTVSGVTNGVVSFAFTANPATTNRTANLFLLGQAIPVTQAGAILTPTPPLLTGATVLASGALQFTFTNYPSATFTVLGSTNLALPLADWTELGAAVNLGGGVFQFTTFGVTNGGQFFYVVRSP